MRQLYALGALAIDDAAGVVRPKPGPVVVGQLVPSMLYSLLREVPGGERGLDAIKAAPTVKASDLGEIVAEALNAVWAQATKEGVGKSFRGWARLAGLLTTRQSKLKVQESGSLSLF